MVDWLAAAPLGAALLHICEEFVYPGGFADWYRHYRVDASRITARFLVIVNGLLLILCWDIIQIGPSPFGVALWLTVAALLAGNGFWHVWASYKSKSYSPGVLTGAMLYVPLAVYGFTQYVRSGAASFGTAIMAGFIGGSYHYWSALYHSSRQLLSGKSGQ